MAKCCVRRRIYPRRTIPSPVIDPDTAVKCHTSLSSPSTRSRVWRGPALGSGGSFHLLPSLHTRSCPLTFPKILARRVVCRVASLHAHGTCSHRSAIQHTRPSSPTALHPQIRSPTAAGARTWCTCSVDRQGTLGSTHAASPQRTDATSTLAFCSTTAGAGQKTSSTSAGGARGSDLGIVMVGRRRGVTSDAAVHRD